MSYRMKEITINPQQIAACGLYCGACKKFLNGKCPGCKENEKASWCKIRKCCQEKDLHTCAECDKDVKECMIHNNFVGKIFAFLFNSDRAACIRYIRENGEDAFAEKMAKDQQMTMKRTPRLKASRSISTRVACTFTVSKVSSSARWQ